MAEYIVNNGKGNEAEKERARYLLSLMLKNRLGDIPPDWINGYDRERKVKASEMYDLKGSPAIYLLDANKKVILKNVIAPEVEHYLLCMQVVEN